MEEQKIPGDGVVTGYGKVDGRQVFLFAQDFTVFGGSLSGAFAEKICKVMDLAAKVGRAVHRAQRRRRRAHPGRRRVARRLRRRLPRNVLASGVIPQISAIMGPCAGGAVYSPAMTDFIIMVKNTATCSSPGPDVIKTVTHEEVTAEELGGARRRTPRKSGVADFAANTEEECIQIIRNLLSFIPQNNLEDPPFVPTEDPAGSHGPGAAHLVPDNPNKPYDIKELIQLVVDDGNFFEVHAALRQEHGGGLRAASAAARSASSRTSRRTGPACSTSTRRRRAARFVRFCDAFNLPIVTFVDVPGFLPGVDQEHGGIITHGAKLLYAFCEATVPRVTIITRKAYGGAYVVMSSKHTRADVNFAYPDGGDRGDGSRRRGEHRVPQRAARSAERSGSRGASSSRPTTARTSRIRSRRRSSATSTR